MNALPSAGGGHGALHLLHPDGCNAVSEFLPPPASSGATKRKRRPAGTPDPGAEVVALSPKTLMESDRYVCEICNQGFQRDQNLQMHRRRHKVPWKLLKRPSLGTHKRVYVCPERSCLHHDPSHALGDLVGIKKHYRRKHCTEKQWKCDKCSKGYAVQSDYKAHLKTCGTRGHCCDCGRVFSRVESFIEHQDTCSAVKHKTMHSGGRKPSHARFTADRASNESPSQSSDTTQAMSFAQSGMSDTAGRSADSTKVIDHDHSRRLHDPSQPAAAAMPAWLTDHRRSELELLPSNKCPDSPAYPGFFASGSPMPATSTRADYGSHSQVTRCSSINSPYPDVSCTGSKPGVAPPVALSSEDATTPSLQLCIGPYGTEVASSSLSPCVDTKPSFSAVEREALALTYQQRQYSPGIPRVGVGVGVSGRPAGALGNDLALSIPVSFAQSRPMEGHEKDGAISLSDFLVQAARRLGPSATQAQTSNVEFQQAKKQQISGRSEMVANYNPGSGSSYHEDHRAGKLHDSEASGMRVSRRGPASLHSQIEPATSMITSRHGVAESHMDAAGTHELFSASQSMDHDQPFRSHMHMDATAARVEANQAHEQARTDMNYTAWSDLAAVRRTKEQARHESDEAQQELARALALKREAHEQLQLASAERAYAERAREVAKRQIEASEADLAKAKRLREHAQAELDKAQFLRERVERSTSMGATSSSQEITPTYCHSCKSAVDMTPLRRTPSSPGPNSTWSFLTPPSTSGAVDQLQLSTGISGSSGQINFMVPGIAGHEGAKAMNVESGRLFSGRMSWSESEAWPGNTSMSTFATSMAVEESDPRFGGDHHTGSAQSGREESSAKNLDLN